MRQSRDQILTSHAGSLPRPDALIEANRALYNDRAAFDRVVDKWFPSIYSAEQKDLLYKSYRPSWGVNGGLPLAVMRGRAVTVG